MGRVLPDAGDTLSHRRRWISRSIVLAQIPKVEPTRFGNDQVGDIERHDSVIGASFRPHTRALPRPLLA